MDTVARLRLAVADPAVVHRYFSHIKTGRADQCWLWTGCAGCTSTTARVAAILREAGVPRRVARKLCPVDAPTLAELARDARGNVHRLGRHFGVSPSTVRRWLAEAGLLGADPEIGCGRCTRIGG